MNPCFYPSACSVEGAYLPSLDGMRFVAFSNFASVFRGFFRAEESVSLRQLQSAVSKVCAMTWTEVNEVCALGRCWRTFASHMEFLKVASLSPCFFE